LSRGIFESQFLKIPVIASNSGGNLELIEDGKTGLLYELNNPHHLATKMNQILESPTLKSQMVKNGYAFVSETFNPSKTVEQEEKVYLKVLEKKREG
jgi:glycosyltransferase involved in cell wall biosynthesis